MDEANSSSILVIDSGMGGVSILNAMAKKLPNESFIYFADYAFLPYGEKPVEEIKQRCLAIVKSFELHKIKAVVLACNSATAAAIRSLRACYNIAFFGTEPGIKPASQKSLQGIAVLATQLTLQSEQFKWLAEQYASGMPLFVQAAPELVELVESGQSNTPLGEQAVRNILETIDQPYDMLLLGCTHFCFLKKQLNIILGDHVEIIDTSSAIADHVTNTLKQQNLCSQANISSDKIPLELLYTQTINASDESNRLNNTEFFEEKLHRLQQSVDSAFKLIDTKKVEVETKLNCSKLN